MKIIVNALPLTGLQTGIGRYVRFLYQELEKLGVEIFYFNGCLIRKMPDPPRADMWAKRTDLLWKLPWPVLVGMRAIFWLRFERELNRCLKGLQKAVYHETTFFPAKCKIPQVFSLYDLSLITCPRNHPRERVFFFNLFFKRRLGYANHIITISEFIRREAITRLFLKPEDITSIHLAPSPFFKPASAEAVRKVLAKYKLPEEYLLFVGTIDPRKNLVLVLRALAILEKPVPLVIAGWKGWGYHELREFVLKLKLQERLRILNYVPDEDLVALYTGARAFLYPSLYEGFGLPILEAMACGCPVICARTSSLPEVAGEAAILVDPFSPKELAEAIEQVITREDIRKALIARGFDRVRLFSWEKTARKTLEVFEQVIDSI